MNKKERTAQKAVGNLETFDVEIIVPVIATVRLSRQVTAVNEADAAEKAQTIIDFETEDTLKKYIKENFKGWRTEINIDYETGLKYKAQIQPRGLSGSNPGECDTTSSA